MREFDVVIATDLRFPGGSSGSTLEEIRALHTAGLRTGIYPLKSHVPGDRPRHSGFAAAAERGACEILEPGAEVTTRLLEFRHPSVIDPFGGALPKITAGTVALVINHPPITPAGRADYMLPYVRARLRSSYGREPRLFPNGPLVRAAIEKYYDGAVLLEPEEWPAVLDVARFAAKRLAPHDPIRIGRHARADPEKWPASAEDIMQAYPERADIDVRILGGAKRPDRVLGRRPRNWTVYEFGARPPEDFLREIDVFVFYHHPKWIEAFSRAMMEAMASALPSVLPPHFQRVFGDAAIYAEPSGVLAAIDRLRDPTEYRDYSERASAFAQGFTHEAYVRRLTELELLPRNPP